MSQEFASYIEALAEEIHRTYCISHQDSTDIEFCLAAIVAVGSVLTSDDISSDFTSRAWFPPFVDSLRHFIQRTIRYCEEEDRKLRTTVN